MSKKKEYSLKYETESNFRAFIKCVGLNKTIKFKCRQSHKLPDIKLVVVLITTNAKDITYRSLCKTGRPSKKPSPVL